ncbi:MAG: hypothetical protein IKJ06_02710, partial [Clostridia bacterium]|nr:hypothetical protein [Clostridia bacterium]
RAINIYVDKNEVYAEDGKDIVTVTVKLEGRSDLANAQYTLVYEPTLFTLQETDKDPETDGTITEMFYKTKGTFEDGEILATYTFKAKPQDHEETDHFFMMEAFSYTYIESIDKEKFEVSSEGKDVTIKLIEYKVEKYVDNILVDETAGEVTTDSFNYDNAPHTFHIVTVPEATVSYEVKYTAPDGTESTSSDVSNIKAEGIYEITYVVNNAIGHGPKNGKFTITIKEPVKVVEVVENYVFADEIGKNLVLVYTKTANVGFSYGSEVMVDVSTSNYEYNNIADDYTYVYGFVTAPIENGTQTDYENMVSHWYQDDAGYEIPAVGTYDEDLNYDGNDDMQDISVAYGVMNGYEGYFSNVKYQKNILKADITGDKMVRGNDAGLIVEAAKN